MRNFMRAISCTNCHFEQTLVSIITSVFIFAIMFMPAAANAGWLKIEHKPFNEGKLVYQGNDHIRSFQHKDRVLAKVVKKVLKVTEPAQNVVILNTKTGFVPSTLRLRAGNRYRIDVVNVNQEHKNSSFMLDGFSQNHSTYYGKVKSFVIEPNQDGIYSFVCPETASQGQIVVYTDKTTGREPAGVMP